MTEPRFTPEEVKARLESLKEDMLSSEREPSAHRIEATSKSQGVLLTNAMVGSAIGTLTPFEATAVSGIATLIGAVLAVGEELRALRKDLVNIHNDTIRGEYDGPGMMKPSPTYWEKSETETAGRLAAAVNAIPAAER